MASLCCLLIIWPLMVVLAILVKVNIAANRGKDGMTDEQLAVWYNDNVIYPDKVRLILYYLRHYSFWMDIRMIFATVLGKRIEYAGEEI